MHRVTMLRPLRATEPEGRDLALDKARVVGIEQDRLLVLTSDGVALAGQRAAGCLLEPEVDDTVLILRDPEQGAFVLNVLVRGEGPGRIRVRGDMTLESEGGTLCLQGREVNLAARETARMEAPRVEIKGVRGEMVMHTLNLVADRALTRVRKISVLAKTIDTVAERLVQKVTDCFRRVERMDETRAGHVSVQAGDFLNIKARDASIIAENDVKVDGSTIRLG